MRSASLKEQRNKLQHLWKEFPENHETILKNHGSKDDVYFEANSYEIMEELVNELDKTICTKLAAESEISNTEDKLKKKFIIGLMQEEEQELIRERESWQKQIDIIQNYYIRLRIEHNVRSEELLIEKDDIEEWHREYEVKLLNKIKKLAETKRSVKLVEIKIPLFNGNVEDWQSFKKLYEKIVHENTDVSKVEKMYHLKSLLRNDALTAIKHLPVSENNYEAAWEILDQRFSNKRVSNASSVKSLWHTTNECMQALSAMNIGIEHADSVIASIIMRKMDKEGLLAYEQITRRTKEIQALDDVLQFLEQLYRRLEAANSRKQHNNYSSYRQPSQKVSLLTESIICLYCKKGGHATDNCRNYLAVSVAERNVWVKSSRTCFKCLKHPFTNKTICENKKSCGRAHHTTLHKDSVMANCVNAAKDVLLATAQVRIENQQGEYVTLTALIDQGSQTTFISEEAAQILQKPRVKINTELYGIGKEWQKYVLADPNFDKSEKIDIVIGGDLYVGVMQNGICKKNGMLGQHTKLGLIISVPLRVKQPGKQRAINMTTNLEKFWEIEDIQENKNLHEDEICMRHYNDTTIKDENERFVVKLPFKAENELENSYKQAMARFMNLEKKLETNEKLKTEYIKFMEEYEALGHMEEVLKKGRAKYYLPHQAVLRKNVITADVEKMYRQIKIHKADQSYQHIIWRSNKNSSLKEYKLTTVTYGTASVPCLAVRTLVEIANNCSNKKLAEIIKEDFYMDDLLTGADTVTECKNIKKEISEAPEEIFNENIYNKNYNEKESEEDELLGISGDTNNHE
ncbi:uncharacterized protein LOC119663716, partial [Teleopsis dalmanni]|uniref:uncharacterized protein LOC119663716 n=1 Tax=Teleopsis dalmanni TaxID=139649 RepID=UPI0018CEFD07